MSHRLLVALPRALAVPLAALLAGCATVQPAAPVLPDALQRDSDRVEAHGLGFGTQGSASVDGRTLRFQRSASRLALFDTLYTADSARVDFTLDAPDGSSARAACRMRRTEAAVGVVAIQPKPLSFVCTLEPPGGSTLTMSEERPGATPQPQRRQGRVQSGSHSLQLESLHALRGAAWPSGRPVGYLFSESGRPVAAVDLTGTRPVLHLPRDDAALRQLTLMSGLALGLLWEPSAP
ncbi:MAG TPA: hypothetical protein VMT83_02280 [Burkholderiaceae bacterium]|nr:hypothetical protein [Burkholderiaceae bacterium]